MTASTVRITMLGDSHAGKTSFMVGLHSVFRIGRNGFTFSCDEDLDVDLAAKWKLLRRPGQERFPKMTSTVDKYSFSFRHGMRPLLQFEWMDYPGMALTKGSSDTDYKNVKEHVLSSTCIMLCISGQTLASGDINDEGDRNAIAEECLIPRMNRLLIECTEAARQRGGEMPPVVIVITKYDHVDVEATIVIGALREMFNSLFAARDVLIAICPVSLGKELAHDVNNGRIEPTNLHLPVAFATYCVHRKRAMELVRRQTIQRQTEVQLGRNWFFEFWNSEAIARTQEEQVLTRAERDAVGEDLKLVISELKSTPFFRNGKEVTFDV